MEMESLGELVGHQSPILDGLDGLGPRFENDLAWFHYWMIDETACSLEEKREMVSQDEQHFEIDFGRGTEIGSGVWVGEDGKVCYLNSTHHVGWGSGMLLSS